MRPWQTAPTRFPHRVSYGAIINDLREKWTLERLSEVMADKQDLSLCDATYNPSMVIGRWNTLKKANS